jgi:4-amino-4-deoxy-L-arabinose transferase-like glycosyltransferase
MSNGSGIDNSRVVLARRAGTPVTVTTIDSNVPKFTLTILDSAGMWKVCLIAILIAIRFALAAYLPLSFDEAYFWLWSKHLAVSYYDHPPLIALAIRLGTLIFGDTEFGVRAIPLLASVGASWAVWRSAAILLADEQSGVTACCLFNATLMVSAETIGATPDALVLAAAAFVLFAMAKLMATSDGRWWLMAGFATGIALLAKYTAFFLGISIAFWLVATPQGYKWLRTVWPFAGGLIALACFVPALAWNATHDWISFKFQFGRMVTGEPTFQYLVEFYLGQFALASPFIFILGAVGLARASKFTVTSQPLSIAAAMVWPALAYFTVHSLHDRVQGNWPSFLYPAFTVLAVSVMAAPLSHQGIDRLLRFARAFAIPVAIGILIFAYAQVTTGMLPLGKRDPIARMTAIGILPVTDEISALARQNDAKAVVTSKYGTTGWLAFYLRPPLPIIEISEDYRWLAAPQATSDLLKKPLLYVTQNPEHELPKVVAHFSKIVPIANLSRTRGGIVIERFQVYLLSGFHGSAVGRMP